MNEAEKRQFYRINLTLPIEYRTIDREEFMSLSEAVAGTPTRTTRAGREHYLNDANSAVTNPEHLELFEQMALINRKLDTILDLLLQGKVYHNVHERHGEVEISGAGIKFITDVALEEGAYVELKLLLPVLPYLKIPILCQVVRSRKLDRGLFEAALEFLVIRETDRDLLVRFVFAKEREAIRSSREGATT
jgi:hypothetical protein